MPFYCFEQNNSGGQFHVDKNLCPRVFIEAEDHFEANQIGIGLGMYFDGVRNNIDCECCGDRWHPTDTDCIDLDYLSRSRGVKFNSVKDYAQYMADRYPAELEVTRPDARIYYINGQIHAIYSGVKQNLDIFDKNAPSDITKEVEKEIIESIDKLLD